MKNNNTILQYKFILLIEMNISIQNWDTGRGYSNQNLTWK